MKERVKGKGKIESLSNLKLRTNAILLKKGPLLHLESNAMKTKDKIKRIKSPTLKEKVEMYEAFLHRINIYVTCCNNEGIKDLVANADRWSYMHRCGNGEPSDKEQQEMVNEAFWQLCSTKSNEEKVNIDINDIKSYILRLFSQKLQYDESLEAGMERRQLEKWLLDWAAK